MARNDVMVRAALRPVQHLSPQQVDTIRLALALLFLTDAGSLELLAARQIECVTGIVSDDEINALLVALAHTREVTLWRVRP